MPTVDNEENRALMSKRLEVAMCTARRWTVERWRELMVGNPVALCLGFTVVLAKDAMAAEQVRAHQSSLETLSRLVGPAATVDEIIGASGW